MKASIWAMMLIVTVPAGTAWATDYGQPEPPPPQVQGQAQGQAQKQGQAQGQGQLQGQAQKQGQHVDISGGAEATTTFNDDSDTRINYEYDTKRHVPAPTAPSMSPSGPCMGVVSGSGTATTFGFSVGKSWTDDGCEERETARLLAEMGAVHTAREILCSSAAVERTIGYTKCMGDEDKLITAIGMPAQINFSLECDEKCKQRERERRKCEAVGDCIPMPPTRK